ncbi:MAG: glutamine synthetase family protein [Spirochaetota bacterium]
MDQNKDYIIKLSRKKNVKFIKLWFTDILGILKSFAITIEELEDALYEGVRFDGSTLNGFVRREEMEMLAMPDIATFQILPWRPQTDSVARMFCDIYTTDMKPFDGDSRYVLKKMLRKSADLGYTFYTGPEIEFFFFRNNISPELLDKGGYFDLTPLDLAADFRRQTVLTLEEMGMQIITSHHEGAHSQHEIDLRHEDALTTADNIMTFRIVTKEIAQINDIYASFMPKPLSNQNGSGMHVHTSLFKDEENIFFDQDADYHLSKHGRQFIAGILTHIKEFTAITNQWINSYKRFIYGYEAPTHISWSSCVNTSLIRIPQHRAEKPRSMRIELRNPDPSCNPYLAFACILAAGLEGITKGYTLDPALEEQKQTPAQYGTYASGFEQLPTHLSEALLHLQKSTLMKETLGDVIINNLIENKLAEIEQFNRYVSDHDIATYYPLL